MRRWGRESRPRGEYGSGTGFLDLTVFTLHIWRPGLDRVKVWAGGPAQSTHLWGTRPTSSPYPQFPSPHSLHRGGVNRNRIPSHRNSTWTGESTADGRSFSGLNNHPHREQREPRACPASGPAGETPSRGRDGEKRGRGRAWAAGQRGTRASPPIYEPQVSFPRRLFFLHVFRRLFFPPPQCFLWPTGTTGRRNRSPRRRAQTLASRVGASTLHGGEGE